MSPEEIQVSFEFFPPRDELMSAQLWAAVRALAPFNPRFVSMTCGADGSTRTSTRQWVERLQGEPGLTVMPHLTCMGATREQIDSLARDYWAAGIRNLLALRGDPPGGAGAALPPTTEGQLASASELVRELSSIEPFNLFVAAYPEGHRENPGITAEIENLKRKVEAGARGAITQFFFDTDDFLRFRDRCATAGIDVPLVPGILPIARVAQTLRFAQRCGARVPEWLRSRFEGLDEEPQTRSLLAAHTAIEQVQRLLRHGVRAFHFYTLNRAELCVAICRAIGMQPGRVRQPAAETRKSASARP